MRQQRHLRSTLSRSLAGGGVALLYAALLQAMGWMLPAQRLWGWFGRCGPRGSNVLLTRLVSHLPCGLGVSALTALR